MTEKEVDFSKYSDSDLEYAFKNVDRSKYPERFQKILEERSARSIGGHSPRPVVPAGVERIITFWYIKFFVGLIFSFIMLSFTLKKLPSNVPIGWTNFLFPIIGAFVGGCILIAIASSLFRAQKRWAYIVALILNILGILEIFSIFTANHWIAKAAVCVSLGFNVYTLILLLKPDVKQFFAKKS